MIKLKKFLLPLSASTALIAAVGIPTTVAITNQRKANGLFMFLLLAKTGIYFHNNSYNTIARNLSEVKLGNNIYNSKYTLEMKSQKNFFSKDYAYWKGSSNAWVTDIYKNPVRAYSIKHQNISQINGWGFWSNGLQFKGNAEVGTNSSSGTYAKLGAEVSFDIQIKDESNSRITEYKVENYDKIFTRFSTEAWISNVTSIDFKTKTDFKLNDYTFVNIDSNLDKVREK